jgi:hypothetical protein
VARLLLFKNGKDKQVLSLAKFNSVWHIFIKQQLCSRAHAGDLEEEGQSLWLPVVLGSLRSMPFRGKVYLSFKINRLVVWLTENIISSVNVSQFLIISNPGFVDPAWVLATGAR